MTVYKTPADRLQAKAEGQQIAVRMFAELRRMGVNLVEELKQLTHHPERPQAISTPGHDAQRLPAIFLIAGAERGMDVQYVITGVRSANPPAPLAAPTEYRCNNGGLWTTPPSRAATAACGPMTQRVVAEFNRLQLPLETLEYLAHVDAHVLRGESIGGSRRKGGDDWRLPAIFLLRAAAKGVDVQHIVTGCRSVVA